jgi:type VI protein secretion system component VasK
MDSIIVAALSLVGTLAGAYFANRKSSALIAYRLEQLEEKVNKHNNVIERTYALESRISVDEEKIARLENFHE